MTFRVGMKCVCVDDKARRLFGGIGTIKAGAIYTIRWVGVFKGVLCIRVEEVVRPCGDDLRNEDTPYAASRFRPLVDSKTEVSFTEANPAPEDSRQWDNRRPVVEPMPVDGWRVSVKT